MLMMIRNYFHVLFSFIISCRIKFNVKDFSIKINYQKTLFLSRNKCTLEFNQFLLNYKNLYKEQRFFEYKIKKLKLNFETKRNIARILNS